MNEVERAHHHIRQLEAEISEQEAELRRVQVEEPKKASVVVAKLKTADSELHTFREELATLTEIESKGWASGWFVVFGCVVLIVGLVGRLL